MDAPLGRGQRQWDEFFPPSVKLELFPVQACGFWLDHSQALHFTLGPGTCLALPGSPLNPPHLLPMFFPFYDDFLSPSPLPSTTVLSHTISKWHLGQTFSPPSREP